MTKTLQSMVPALAICFLARAAPPQPHKAEDGTYVVRAAEELLRKVVEDTPQRRCSVIFVKDSDGYSFTSTLPDDKNFIHHLLRTMTDGATVFEVVDEREDDANLTYTLLARVVAQARRLRRLLSWFVTVLLVSDNPAFLAAFAEAADSGRLMVWQTRLLVVTRLAKSEIRGLMQDYWTFSMMNTMFLKPISEYGDVRCQLYVHLPYTPTGARMELVASWSTSHGLVQHSGHTIFPEKYKNFHGMSINVTWFPMAPYFMEITDPDNKTNQAPRYAGRDFLILEGIAGALNFSSNVHPYNELDHVLTHLATRQAYIRPFRVALLPHLMGMFDFTIFIERATLAFGMAKPTLKPSWQSLYYPLQPAVWGSIVASVLLVLAVLMVIKPRGEEKVLGAWLVVKQVVGTLLDEAIPGELPRRSSTRAVLAAWLIFAFIVGTVYRSNLTASLTVLKYPPRAETLSDLIDTGAKIVFPDTPDTPSFIDGFKRSNSSIYRKVGQRVRIVSSLPIGIKYAIEDKVAVMYERLNMMIKIAEEFTSKKGSTPMYVAKGYVLPDYTGWPLTPNAPFKDNLDHYILAFHGAGLIKRWTTEVLRKAQFDAQQQQTKSTKEQNFNPMEENASDQATMALTLVHMQGPLFLYLAGAFLSLAMFFGENVIPLCQSESIIKGLQCPATSQTFCSN